MKKLFVVTLLSLAAAGCAQLCSAVTKQDSPLPGPVAVTPIQPMSETINRGMGNSAVVRTAIKDPDSRNGLGDPRRSRK